jgi:hypothetical protein
VSTLRIAAALLSLRSRDRSRAGRAALQVQAGIGIVAVSGLDPGVEVVLQDRKGREVGRGTTDRFGSFMFRELEQGARYSLRAGSADPVSVTVLEFGHNPDPSFYRQQVLHEASSTSRRATGRSSRRRCAGRS